MLSFPMIESFLIKPVKKHTRYNLVSRSLIITLIIQDTSSREKI